MIQGRSFSFWLVGGAILPLLTLASCRCNGPGLGTCPAEICNGVDDDCDGETDEDLEWENKGETCFVGQGACQAAGVFICDETNRKGGTVCSGAPGLPATEICNGADDDCDGETDEDSLWANRGEVCRAQEGGCVGVGVFVCDSTDATASTVCDAIAGPPTEEVCNGFDDDCDGETDEGVLWADRGSFCAGGVGLCARPGLMVCDPADPTGPTLCNAQPAAQAPEVCNGLDDDCDGETDEGVLWADKGVVCIEGQGICETPGIRLCDPADPAGPTICSASLRTSGSPEVCNGLDDDCDGQTDEGLSWGDKGSLCSLGAGACQRTGVLICNPLDPAAPTICNAVAGTPGIEVCDRVDNDCDGATDEDAPWSDLGAICRAGSGACETVGVKVCDTTTPLGPTVCSVSAGSGGLEVCNGLDDDCDGATDEDPQWSNKGTVCTAGSGLCENTGTMVCDTADPGGPTVCSAQVGAQGVEVCNGLDDDCDGQTDEVEWTDKGSICTAGIGACLQTGNRVCDTGNPAGPTVCSVTGGTAGSEVCNGLDDNCDGATDEVIWLDLGQGCISGQGVCAQPGIKVCDTGNPSGPTVCSANPGPVGTEVCNGLDDNCDGSTDEGVTWVDKGQACSDGQGICLAAGIKICDPVTPGGPTVCSATAGVAGTESCNGLDDDCDGIADNALTAPGCVNQNGVCLGSVQTCGGPFGWQACTGAEYGPSYEPVEISCDGLDNDCDGLPDGSLPPQPCANQSGVCAGSFASCGGGGWNACGAADYGVNYQGIETTCDAMDNNCDGVTDEGWLNGATGKYDRDTACGSCFIDCTAVFAKPNARGSCDATGIPQCQMICCTVGDTNPACDGTSDYLDLDGIPDNGCEFRIDPSVVFVSTPANGGADSAACGAQVSPCASIAQGLARASAQPVKTRVHVSSGAYYENVTLLDGLDLHGGFNPVTWLRNPAANTTAIYGATGAGHRKAVVADGIIAGLSFDGFVIYGANASSDGANSYGIWVRDSGAALSITNNVVWAGSGQPGVDALPGGNGPDGGGGLSGLPAKELGYASCAKECLAGSESAGGAGGVGICGAIDVSGGRGGRGDCPDFDELSDQCIWCAGTNEFQTVTTSGAPGANGGAPGGLGGCDAHMNSICEGSCVCLQPSVCPQGTNAAAGIAGSAGLPGARGSGCSTSGGVVVGSEWLGVSGSVGSPGAPGGGGGGGGAGGGVETFQTTACGVTNFSDIGGSGGGGGAGGCEGGAGLSGGAGGASFGIFVVFQAVPGSVPTISGNVVNPGTGGRGGDGGNGGVGGAGGNPGQGGAGGLGGSTYWCAAPGFPGGAGGDGGHGGGGGGGCGGVAYGIFASGQGGVSLAAWKSGNTFNPTGAGGAGGSGGGSGAGGNVGLPGAAGAAANTNF